MRKALVLALGVALIAPLAFAQTNVLSQNAVGYVKRTVNPGEFDYIQIPFVTIDGSTNKVSDVFGDLPDGSNVLTWDPVGQTYIQSSKSFFGWAPDVDLVLGQGFFLQIPGTEAAPVDVYLLGEVPSDATVDIPLVSGGGFAAVGVPYPAALTIETSGLDAALVSGDSVLVWDIVGQGYVQVSKSFFGWAPANTPLNPGDGFFVQAAAGGTYTETKPYSWP